MALSLRGSVLGWNHAAARALRRSAEETVGRSILGLVAEESRTLAGRLVDRAAFEDSALRSTLTFLTGDGAPLCLDVSVAAVRGADGAPVALSLLAREAPGEPPLAETLTESELRARAHQQAVVSELGLRALSGAEPLALLSEAAALVTETLGVEYCEVMELLPDGKELLLSGGRGWYKATVGKTTVSAARGSHAGYTLLSAEPVIVDDLRTETRFTASPLLRAHKVISGVSVVIHGSARPWGVLGAHTTRRRSFTQDDINFLQAIANGLGAAIDRSRAEKERAELLAREKAARSAAEQAARLHREAEQRLSLLAEASSALLGSLQLSDVLSATLSLARRLVAADAYAVWRHQSEAEEWRVVCSSGLSETYTSESVPDLGQGAQVLTGPLAVEDVEAEPLLAGRRRGLAAEGIRSILILPLAIRGERSGTLNLYYRSPHRFLDLEVRVATALGNLAASAIGTAELYEEQSRLRAEAEAAQARFAFLAQATALLSSSLDHETTLQSVARLSVSRFSDWCAVDIVRPDGTTETLVAEHIDPAKVHWAQEVRRRYPSDPQARYGVPEAIRTGQSILYSEISDETLEKISRDPEHLRLLRKVGMCSAMVVPLLARGRTLGAMTFIAAESGRRYGPADLALAEDLARRAAIALDNARLYREAQQAKASLQQQFDLNTAVMGSLGEGVCALDPQGRITFVNPAGARLLAQEPAQLLGQDFHSLVHPGCAHGEQPPACPLRSAIRGGLALHSFDGHLSRAEGHGLSVAYTVSPILTDHGVAGTVLAFHDITERKEAERRLSEQAQELARSNAELEQFAYVASHDLQEPLRMVASYTQLLARRYQGRLDADADEFIAFAVDGVNRMQELIVDLLAYSRVRMAGRTREPTDCDAVLDRVLASLRAHLESSGATITRDPLPTVPADPTQLGQVFQNLLSNALKFRAEEPPRVHIRADDDGDHWTFSVRDNGIGVDPQYASRIFVIFQRLHSKGRYPGTGIGLAICQKIVEGHGGRIWVDSKDGPGATFRFTLPKEAR